MELNNSTTIATWAGILALIIEVLIKHFGITVEHQTILMLATGIVTFIIAVISSKHPNTFDFLGNAPTPVDAEEPVLNDEYEV